ncbi:mediator of RNA polymerase II transcription subunit 19-B-like isoform X2 [Glandiceps talaboti]
MEGMKRPPDPSSQKLGVRSPKLQTMRQKSPLPIKPSTVSSGDPDSFYLMRDMSELHGITGETNLVSHHGLEHTYNKFCSKKVKEQLSAFLPTLPGMIDTVGSQDNSSLRSLIEKQPILGKEYIPLSGPALAGFRLHPGPIPEQYRLMHQQPQKRKHKHKKHKKEHRSDPIENPAETTVDASHDKKHKKQKKHEGDGEKRKKKKDKKKKKSRHSPEHQGIAGLMETNGPGRPT